MSKQKTIKEIQKEAYKVLKDKFGYTNVMESPRVMKAIISVGVGSVKDKKKIELISKRLATMTGQKAAPRATKKAIAGFKTRLGDVVGYQVTIRGKRMDGFLEKLFNVTLPRTKDFRGISRTAVDEMGNLTIGIKEHTIFPEIMDEELKDVFGLAITIVTTATSKEQATAFFELLGVPFKKA